MVTGEHSEPVIVGGSNERETSSLGPAAGESDERHRGGGRGQDDRSRRSAGGDGGGGDEVSAGEQLLSAGLGHPGTWGDWRLGTGSVVSSHSHCVQLESIAIVLILSLGQHKLFTKYKAKLMLQKLRTYGMYSQGKVY